MRLMEVAAAALLLSQAAGASDIWLDVPYVKQKQNGCGIAAIQMIARYWAEKGAAGNRGETGIPEPDSIGASGMSSAEMEQYLKTRGFQVFVFSAGWNDLEHHLSRGRPLIVALAPEGKNGRFHYAVVAGIDTPGSTILLNDPAERKLLRTSRAQFERMWAPMNSWTLLALPSTERN